METILDTSEETPHVDTVESLNEQLTKYTVERDAAEKDFCRLLKEQDESARAGQATDYTESDAALERRNQCDRIIDNLQNNLIPAAHQEIDLAKHAESQEQIDNMIYRRDIAASEIEGYLDKIEQILISYRATNEGIPGHGHKKYHPLGYVKMTNRLHKTFQVRTRGRQVNSMRKEDDPNKIY